MGTSKNYKAGPGWSAPKDPGNKANAKASAHPAKGTRSTAEGTHMSAGPKMRGDTYNAGMKSSASRSSAKNSGPYGES